MRAPSIDVTSGYTGAAAAEDFIEEAAPLAGRHFMANESRLEQGVRRTEQRLRSEPSETERKGRNLW